MSSETIRTGRVKHYAVLEPGDRYFYLSDGNETTWGIPRSQIVVNRYVGWGREWYDAITVIESDGERLILVSKTTQETYRQAQMHGRTRHIVLSQDTVFPTGTLSATDETALFLAHSYDEQKQSHASTNHRPLDLDRPEPADHPLCNTLFTYQDYQRKSGNA